MRDAVTGIQHDTCCSAGRIEGEHRLDRHVEGGDIEGLEHDLGRDIPVLARVERRLCQEHRMILGKGLQLALVHVVPDLFHVVPVRHHTMLKRVADLEQSAQLLRLLSDEHVAF